MTPEKVEERACGSDSLLKHRARRDAANTPPMSKERLYVYIENTVNELDNVETRIKGLGHSKAIFDILEDDKSALRVEQKINALKFVHQENWEIVFGNLEDNPFSTWPY